MDLRYPIGQPRLVQTLAPDERIALVDQIARLPEGLSEAVFTLDNAQLDTRYREGGWTLRQVVHHLADSHINGYTRFRLALTEDHPTIRPYDEDEWAHLEDARTLPPTVSLVLLKGLHTRWATLLRGLRARDWAATLHHPDDGDRTLDQMLQTYAWHGQHHLAHITVCKEMNGW